MGPSPQLLLTTWNPSETRTYIFEIPDSSLLLSLISLCQQRQVMITQEYLTALSQCTCVSYRNIGYFAWTNTGRPMNMNHENRRCLSCLRQQITSDPWKQRHHGYREVNVFVYLAHHTTKHLETGGITVIVKYMSLCTLPTI